MPSKMVETDVLVIGTGPAGAASAAALATYGVDTIVVSKYGWTSRTPRAHITNQRTMEVLRDLGLEQEAIELAAPNTLMGENTYCTSLAGEEFGRLLTWGVHPDRRADYDKASPTAMCDLPQNYMEAILTRTAAHRGAKVRFDTEYVRSMQDADGVTSTVRDRLTGEEYQIRSQYLIGADGANSKVVEDYGLPVEGKMGVEGSMNIIFDADLSKYVAHRPSVLYWIIQPGSKVGGLGIGVIRMVRTWHRWLAIWGFDLAQGPPELTDESATAILRNMIGDDGIDIKIDSTSIWTVNDAYVSTIAKDRVFAMGDAIHRHPPTNGLGSNASIGDAYNLAWKLAMVLKGQAGPGLLASYNQERAPIAKQTVRRANQSLGLFPPILGALGLLEDDNPEHMKANMQALKEATPEAAARRDALRQAIDGSDYVYNCHGVELNQRYFDSSAVVPDGTPDPGYSRDGELYFEASSRPGARLPHAWLTKDGHRVSTLDLCGKGRFALLGRVGGKAWADAIGPVAARLGLDIPAHLIGIGHEYDDPYGDWQRLSEIDHDGVLLVRPDLHIAYRSKGCVADPAAELEAALKLVLALA